MNIKAKNIIFITAIFIAVIFPFSFLDAASYDFYVDKSYEGEDSDGNSEKPYKTIQKALEESGNGSRIYIRNGEYSESLTIPRGVGLFGQDKNKTIINIPGTSAEDSIWAKDDNTFKNLTFSGGISALTIEGKATISNCIIKNALKKGIDLTEGGSSATIEKSKITGNGKGIYVQKGRTVFIDENEILRNDEEGLDIRQKVNGSVSKNDISDNGEGGIEVIIGSSSLRITGNTIKNNKASGIANQFYPQAKKTGKITFSKNTITKNGNYGILCNAPSGNKGLSPESYWNDSLDIKNNNISSNGKKEISDSCVLIEAISEDEKKTNIVSENESSSEDETSDGGSASEKSSQEESNQDLDENSQDYENKLNEIRKSFLEDKKMEINHLIYSASQKKSALNKNWIGALFRGYSDKKISSAREENEKIKEQISLLEEVKNQTKSEEIRLSAETLIEKATNNYNENEAFLNQKENFFSLFGWLF